MDLDEKEIVVLAVLNGLYSNKMEQLATSVNIIGYFVTGRFLKMTVQRDRTILQNIRIGIQSLAERKIITINDQNDDNYIISNNGLQVDPEKDKFIVVELWELQKIFSVSNKPFNVFAYFVNLIGTINNQTKEWHMSQDEMAVKLGMSKRTVNDYLEQLEEMHLIYAYRHRKRRIDGTYQKINNSYGRYGDKENVVIEALKYAETVECEDISEKLDRRAIKLRYNAFCGGSRKYKDDPDTISALYKECLQYNESLKIKPVDGTYDGEWRQGDLLDLSVFPSTVVNEKMQWGEASPYK